MQRCSNFWEFHFVAYCSADLLEEEDINQPEICSSLHKFTKTEQVENLSWRLYDVASVISGREVDGSPKHLKTLIEC